MNNLEFVVALKEEFEKQLQSKTNWGRNEVMMKFLEANTNVLARAMEVKQA